MPRTKERSSRNSEARRLKAVRLELGLSQREMADELRVGHSAIALWETAARTMPGPALRLVELFEEELGMQDSEKRDDQGGLARIPTTRWARSARLSRDVVSGAASLAGAAMVGLVQSDERKSQIRQSAQAAVTRRMASTLGELKGVSMKLGQMMSYLDFALPPAARELLASLQSSSAPMSHDVVVDIFLEELGRTPKQLFAEWTQTPFAAASIGQVHKARLHSGEEVAVKVQYPGIVEAVRSDLKNLGLVDKLLTTMFPQQDKGALSAELEARILEECDYRREAQNQASFRARLEQRSDVLVPRSYPELSTSRILVSEFMHGQSFAEFNATASQAEKNRAGATLFQVAWESILVHGMFNADPHPGNYLFADGKVVLLDFGCVKRYEPDFIAVWHRLIRSTLEDDRAAAVEVVRAMGLTRDPARYNFDYHRQMMHALYKPWLAEGSFRFSSEFVTETWRSLIVDNQNKYRMNMPRDWVFANRLQWGLYGVLALLHAEADFRTMILDLVYAPGETRPNPVVAS